MTFETLGVAPQFIAQLEAMNIVVPLPIQQCVIPSALRGESLLVSSQTGSGKTLTYLIPLVQRLVSSDNSSAKALILAPTRELAQQIGVVCAQLCQGTSITSAVIVGGVSYQSQHDALALQPDIIIATPGRYVDLLEQGVIAKSGVEYFILDEVDQMLDLGFRETIVALAQLRSDSATSFYFSATLPADVVDMLTLLSPTLTRLSLSDEPMTVASVEHLGYYVEFEMMDRLLIHLLRTETPQQSIIFTRSRKMADRVVGVLSENGITAEAIHSDRSQVAREHIIARFRSGETSILVATDVMARGIDVDSVTHVYNFGLPQSAEQYIHRCGRAGRVGRSGKALSLFTPEEKPILDVICRLMRRHVVIDTTHPYMTPNITRALSTPSNVKKKGKKQR